MNGYEEKIKELDSVIKRLESGDISLQEAMDLYRRGNELMGACAEMLQSYRAEAQEIMQKTEVVMKEAEQS